MKKNNCNILEYRNAKYYIIMDRLFCIFLSYFNLFDFITIHHFINIFALIKFIKFGISTRGTLRVLNSYMKQKSLQFSG